VERDFWLERWRTGATGWHQTDVHPFLARHGEWLVTGAAGSRHSAAHGAVASQPTREPRVFVPLCGASRDMLWLRRAGAAVVGIDLAAEAFRRFYDDADLDPAIDRTCLFERWHADGVELLAGDFFDADASVLGAFDAVYDRAALFALPPAMRERYAQHMADLCAPGTRLLQITFDYDQREMTGPPFAVDGTELGRLYGGAFSIERVERLDVLADNANMRSRGVRSLHEEAWRFVRR
jgi:thiopurine S-methyltransferase